MSERLPQLDPHGTKIRMRATSQILRTYRDNQVRLLSELAKEPQDRFTKNNISAYRHILGWLEELYDI